MQINNDKVKQRWEALKVHILEEIQKIDDDTVWQEKEPQWWLEMSDIGAAIKYPEIWTVQRK